MCVDSSMVNKEQGSFQNQDGGSNPTSTLQFSVKSLPRKETLSWLLNKHYARRIPAISYSYGLYDNNNILIGICTLGEPPISNWSDVGFDIIELNRLCVNDNLPKNSLSFFVSKVLKLLPKPLLIISFADPNNGHHGYIYQATNWIYTGTGSENKRWFLNKKEYHSRHLHKSDPYFIDLVKKYNSNIDFSNTAEKIWLSIGGTLLDQKPKYRYFYIIGKKTDKIKIINWLRNKYSFLPYPKGENKRYDASYVPEVQKVFF